MPDDLRVHTPDPKEESERIRKWREERARVAEEEKQERIRKAAEDKARRAEEEAVARRHEAEALLPTEDDLVVFGASLKRKRRQRKARLLLELAVFVLLPAALCFIYLSQYATPLYEARSVIAISRTGPSSENGAGGLLSSMSSNAASAEIFMAHEYVQSQDLMDTLETEMGLVTELSGDRVDPLRRLRDVPMLQLGKQDQFSRFVDASINIQSGLMTLYVRLPNPVQSTEVSEKILERTADRMNALAGDLFGERLGLATRSVEAARADLRMAQETLTGLQIDSGETDPRQTVEVIYARIRDLESESQNLRADITRAEIEGRGNSYTTQKITDMEARLRDQIAAQRDLLEHGSDGQSMALNTRLMQYELATLDVRVAEQALASALQSLSEARDAAALDLSLFQVVVPPRTSGTASHPNAAMSALVVLLIALGLFAAIKFILPSRP
ncbi:hypothetical protein AAD018_015870 [Aestuariibius insulae]|uniref:hypothetical protein n=1 Tax=Aestuariibius insulae TaxID=2058287 RepID=UPI00345E3ADB